VALASGLASFQRFFVTGELPDEVTAAFVQALTARSFGRSGPLRDDTQVGWIGPRHLFETDLDAEQIACGAFAHLGLRVDRLSVPANVLRSYVALEEQAAREASGRDVLSRTQQRQAREAARERATQEQQSGAFRRPKSYPVLIDLARRMVYLGGTSPTLADKLMVLFNDTFGTPLEPADPGRLAERHILTLRRSARPLEQLAPATFVAPPDGSDGGIEIASDLSFLGRELLTWLWYHSNVDDGPLQLDGKREVALMIDKTARLKCAFGLTGVTAITADTPTRLPEARAALRIGKLPTRLGLVLGSTVGEYRFVLDGQRLGGVGGDAAGSGS
jgi:hypothetical protein